MNPSENNDSSIKPTIYQVNEGTIIDLDNWDFSSDDNQNVQVTNTDEQKLSASTYDKESSRIASAAKKEVWVNGRRQADLDMALENNSSIVRPASYQFSEGSIIDLADGEVSSEDNQNVQVTNTEEQKPSAPTEDKNSTRNASAAKKEVERRLKPRNVINEEDDIAYKRQDEFTGIRKVADTDLDLMYKHQLQSRSYQTRSPPRDEHAMPEFDSNNLRKNWNATTPGAIRVSGRRQATVSGRRQADPDIDAIICGDEHVNSIPLAAEVYEEKNDDVLIVEATRLHQYSFKTMFVVVSGLLLLIIAIVVSITLLMTNSGDAPSSPPLSQHIGTYENLILAVDKYLSGGENQTEIVNLCGNIQDWDVTNIRSFARLFSSDRNPLAANFSEDLSNWDVSDATDMSLMFSGASMFTGNVSGWNVSSVTDMHRMFHDATIFAGDLSRWDVSSVTSMDAMFQNALAFQGNGIGRWQTNRVTTMIFMFRNARVFDANLSGWDLTSLKHTDAMFDKAVSYTGKGIEAWNTSGIESMAGLFWYTSKFDANLSHWDVKKVTQMHCMFVGATNFTGRGLDRWILHENVNVWNMFCGATSFNRNNIASWNVEDLDC